MIRNNNTNNTANLFISPTTIVMEEHIDDNLNFNLFYQVSRLQQIQAQQQIQTQQLVRAQQRVQAQQQIQAQQREYKNYLTFVPYDFIVFDQVFTSQSPYNSLSE